MKPELILQYAKEFKATVTDLADEIDPDNEQDWFSMVIGWGLAKGLQPDEAHQLARNFTSTGVA